MDDNKEIKNVLLTNQEKYDIIRYIKGEIMDKNIIKEMFNILFNSFSSNIVGFLIAIIIVAIPIGFVLGIYLALEHFFGVTVAGYTFLAFCVLGVLFVLLDATISWIKKVYRQAEINIRRKR